jgi:hypothetical protein
MTTIEIISIEDEPIAVIEVPANSGTSFFQAMQNYITLDGGRPLDVMANMEPLDGGGV